MRAMIARRGIALGSTLLVASCSFFVSLDGLQNGALDASTGDANALDTSSDAIGDATGDAPRASTDAGGYCASLSPTPTLCNDFDEDAGLGAGWLSEIVGIGTVRIDTSDASSSPASLDTAVGAFDGGPDDFESANIYQAVPGNPTHLHAGCDLKLDQVDTVGHMETLNINIQLADDNFSVFVYVDTAGLRLYNEDSPTDGSFVQEDFPMASLPPVGSEFERVEIDLDLSTAPPTASASVGGSAVLTNQPLGLGLRPGVTHYSAGIAYVGTHSGGWEIHVDNVTLDAKP